MGDLYPSRLAAFVRSIAVLALPAAGQEAWLETLGPVASWNVSELGLEFDDGFVMLRQWVEAGWVAEQARQAIEHLNQALDALSQGEYRTLWSRPALREAPEWESMRRLASAALMEFV
jgi:hypothetical protein